MRERRDRFLAEDSINHCAPRASSRRDEARRGKAKGRSGVRRVNRVDRSSASMASASCVSAPRAGRGSSHGKSIGLHGGGRFHRAGKILLLSLSLLSSLLASLSRPRGICLFLSRLQVPLSTRPNRVRLPVRDPPSRSCGPSERRRDRQAVNSHLSLQPP